VLDKLREMIVSTKRKSIAATLRGMSERPDSTELLAKINVPTLAIVGSEDSLIPPAEMRQIAEAIPDARFVEISDAGHLAPMEEPQTVNAAIRQFLEAVG
jgi:pimeloyl-ACP methyl ester carboxylesterase